VFLFRGRPTTSTWATEAALLLLLLLLLLVVVVVPAAVAVAVAATRAPALKRHPRRRVLGRLRGEKHQQRPVAQQELPSAKMGEVQKRRLLKETNCFFRATRTRK
jgi:hypothetical protein